MAWERRVLAENRYHLLSSPTKITASWCLKSWRQVIYFDWDNKSTSSSRKTRKSSGAKC